MKHCKEGPWFVKNNHNNKLTENINRLFKNGSLHDTTHKCHMKNPNIWEKSIGDKCVGSIINMKLLNNVDF